MKKQLLIIGIIILLVCVGFSGCFEKKTNDGKIDEETIVSQSKEICNESHYKMAFLLIENANNTATQNDIELINLLKTNASERFSWATKNLASLDTKDEVSVMSMEGNPSYQEIANNFYEKHEDTYDFLTIYVTYNDSNNMYHYLVKNQIQGIGLSIFNNSDSYGSKGKLIGINWMKDIDMDVEYYERFNHSIKLGVNAILHETSHQWGAYVDFIDENGQRSNSLRNPYNMAHWDKKLETGYDLLDGYSWRDNGNGTFTAKVTDFMQGYSQLDLYLMGLMSKDEVSPLKLINSTSDTKYMDVGTTISGSIRTISIQQIIDVAGNRTCICI